MGGSHSEQKDEYKEFMKGLNKAEAARVVVAVDFSLSNKLRANCWGGKNASKEGSLHAAHEAYCGQNIHPDLVQSPYRRALTLLGYVIPDLDSNDEGYTLMGYSDEIKYCDKVEGKSGKMLLKEYDDLAAEFNQENPPRFQQKAGTTIAPVIYRVIDLCAQLKEFYVLIILTDGGLNQIALDTQAVIDASNFPISITTIGIGDSDFSQLKFFDVNLFTRKFDNFHFTKFEYAEMREGKYVLKGRKAETQRDALVEKKDDDEQSVGEGFGVQKGISPEDLPKRPTSLNKVEYAMMQDFQMEVFEEIEHQHQDVMDMMCMDKLKMVFV